MAEGSAEDKASADGEGYHDGRSSEESSMVATHTSLLVRLQEGAMHLRRKAKVFEQRRVNRLRVGRFAVEREQIVSPLGLRDLDDDDADFEISEAESNQLFVSDGDTILVKHSSARPSQVVVPEDELVLQDSPHLHPRQDSPILSEEPCTLTFSFEEKPCDEQSTASSSQQRASLLRRGSTLKLRWVLEHRYFTYSVSLTVVLNAFFIFLDEEQRAEKNLGRAWSEASQSAFVAVDIVFDLLFFTEMTVRVTVERMAFWCQPWNLLDFGLVTVAFAGKLNLLLFGGSNDASRWFRVFRLGRLLWLLHLFESLWIIIIGVLSAMRTIVWAFVLLLIILYVFGIMAARTVGRAIDPSEHPEDAALMRKWFGGIPESMFTLLAMMTMEGWEQVARKVMQYQGAHLCLFFFLFFSLTTWGLMNMVVAVIIDATVGKALHHLENYVKVTAAERHEAIKKICDCFMITGCASTEKLTRVQFIKSLDDRDFVSKLHEVGVDARQAHTLFDLLDFDKSGELSMTEFTEGVLEARGKGHAMDVLRLKYDLRRCFLKIDTSTASLRGVVGPEARPLITEAASIKSALQAAALSCREACPSPPSTET